MPQFFINKTISTGCSVEIEKAEAHHIIDVLRLKAGDKIVFSDGNGASFNATITSTKQKIVKATIQEKRPTINTANLPTLAIGITKHDKLEFIIQKAVELGCPHIIPFTSARTVPKYTQAVTEKKVERWNRIALEAAKQSGLPLKPRVEKPISFDELCKRFKQFDQSLLFWEGEDKNSTKKLFEREKLSNPIIIVGPEGGFAPEEVKAAKLAGAKSLSLGIQILRVETAAIAALTLCQHQMGNLSL